MKRLSFVVPVFTAVALAMMVRPALAAQPHSLFALTQAPEPSTIVAFVGLGAMGLIGMFLQWRKRR